MEMSFNWVSTLSYFGLALKKCTLSPARRKQSLVDIPGADGSVDLLQNAETPTYESRTVTAIFEIVSNCARDTIDRLLDELDGRIMPLTLPGDSSRYMVGSIRLSYGSCEIGAEVCVIATCGPWRVSVQPVELEIPASDTAQVYQLYNSGKRRAVPEIEVPAGDVTIRVGNVTKVYSAGSHFLPEFSIPGKESLEFSFSGAALILSYREAIL